MARKKKSEDIPTEEVSGVDNNPLAIDLPPITETTSDFITSDSEPDDEAGRSDTPPPVNAGAETVRGTLSTEGEEYDPALHSFPPRETAKGVWKKRRKSSLSDSAPSIDDLPNANYRREAEKAAALYAATHTTFFGADASPAKGELVPLVDAWESYFQTNGLRQVPPWAAVLLTHAGYTHSILTRETIWPRVRNWGIKVATKIGLIKRAYPNSGDQRERKDDVGKVDRPAESDKQGFDLRS